MTTKAVIAARLPIRRGLTEAEAAIYVGIGVTKFREMRVKGTMPPPRLLGGAKAWDVDELDAAFKNLPIEGGGAPDTWADFRDGELQT